ncbi:MAG: ribonuclease P protein component [Candidatus Firestonebacteria bacterium RIFOXYA2_FULL_40_8]|nr:MAG: ribonuclease P protein component [Candidatus Firestonebacteria bacterium RIFOXYA2_FULL_40_8]
MIDSLTSNEVKKLFEKGKRIRGRDISLIIGESGSGHFRFAVLPAKVKPAVKRNAVRRAVREAVRNLREELPKKKTAAIITSEKILKKSKEEILSIVKKMFTESGLL